MNPFSQIQFQLRTKATGKQRLHQRNVKKANNFAITMTFVITTFCVTTIKFVITTVVVITMKHAITSNVANTHSTQGSSRTQSIGRSSSMLVPNFQWLFYQHVSSIQAIASETCIYQELCWARSCRLWL